MGSNVCKEYNYFEDVNPHYKKSGFVWKNRIDPDSESCSLYENLWKIFFFDEGKNKTYDLFIY